MQNDLNNLTQPKNFENAWKWINSSQDYRYKNYFRDLYQVYSFAKEENLKDLRKRVKNNTFQPTKPEKVYIPKKNGLLRPITLLSIEDQIVYQAFTNVIAEYHRKNNYKNYNQVVFGNLYSKKNNDFFYYKWVDSYKLMNSKIKKAFNNGKKYIASFDITAFYESIDHSILSEFLLEYGIDKEFIDRFINYMSIWTSDGSFIQGSGLPQGPLSSGLISEVVISYIDNKYKKKKFEKGVQYFRYVDDIKLLADNEINLRKSLVRLDYYSKRIGLLPQSSKTELHKIGEIDEELKNLSEPFAKIKESNFSVSSYKAERELKKIIRNNEITNITRFKIYLPHIEPKHKISKKLVKLLYAHPFL